MQRRRRQLGAIGTLAFGLCACLAGCSLPLSHTCQTSDDCIAGECLEGVCRDHQPRDASATDSSTESGHDTSADRDDALVGRAIDGPEDVSVASDVSAASDAGDTDTSPDGPSDSVEDVEDAEDADASSMDAQDAQDASPTADGGAQQREPCGPAWAEWPMPAPATLTGNPANPQQNLPNPTSYDTSEPDVVIDNVTHLVWQRVMSNEARNYDQAASYCVTLGLAGRTDWRLPSRIELTSLIDFDRSRLGNIDSAFPNPPGQTLWACTPGPGNPLVARAVNFYDGTSGIAAKTSTFLARCVSGSRASTPPPARYDIGSDGTVTDIKTHLTWQAAPAPTDLSWGDGLEYCQGLGPGWRLPTLLELQTLIDETQVTAAVDRATFADNPDESYWTSSYFDSNPTVAWLVSMGYGGTFSLPMSDLWGVRCVR